MSFESIELGAFEYLRQTEFRSVPNEKGIYIVMVPDLFDVEFIDDTTAITAYRGKSLLYSVSVLRTKYDSSDRKILYIGKAGGKSNELHQRIKQYVRYGYGEVTNHRGGRAVWQIRNSNQLLIRYYICEEPEAQERSLLTEYFNRYRTLPVANWRF